MKDFRSCIKGIWAFSKPVRGRTAVTVLLGLLRVALSLYFVWISKALVDIVTGHLDKELNLYVGIMISIVLLQILLSLAFSCWVSKTSIKTQNAMRYGVFSHVLRSTWNGREFYHSGDILNRIQEDIRVIVDLVCSRVPDIIITACQLVAASVFLISMAPKLLLLLVILMIVAVLGSKMYYRTIRTLTTRIRELDSKSQQHIQENLQNRVLVLTLIGVERVLLKFGEIQKDIEKIFLTRLRYSTVARGFMAVGFMAGYLAAFLWGIYGIRDGVVTYGMMTAFLQLVGQVQRPLADLSKHVPAVIQALTSEERLSDLVNLKTFDIEKGKVLDKAPSISFENVSFSYPDSDKNELVLKDFSFTFEAGSLTVVMGPTGRGKSTLIRLAMGLLTPQSGTVRSCPMCNFMYVPQGNTLMSGSIRENLLLADPSATEEQMRDALSVAAADFVFTLPDALDTRCGESGTGLSEGQAQRIAIARALLHNGTVLILDEASSALDSTTEDLFLSRLVKACHGQKTIIFISHRERAISYADYVLKL